MVGTRNGDEAMDRRSFTNELKQRKLALLAESEGLATIDELLELAARDVISPGICTNEGCACTAEYEPDQDRGWCELCDEDTVASALILADRI